MTTITITDPALVDRLLHTGAGELEDDGGLPLVTFSPARPAPGGVTRADVRVMRLQLEALRRRTETEPLDLTLDSKPPAGFVMPPLPERGPAHLERGKPLLEALRDLEERL